MSFRHSWGIAILLSGCALWADDSAVTVKEAAPAPAETPSPAIPGYTPSAPAPGETVTPGDVSLTEEQMKLLNQKIDVGRVDIDRLRDIIEEQESGEPLRMSLDDCIRLAIDNNPDLQVVRYETLKSSSDVFTAKGEFDPLLSASHTYTKSEEQAPPEYQVFGGISSFQSKRAADSASVAGKLQTGTIYNATFQLNKESSTFTRLVSEYSGGLTLTLSQPLLRGRGSSVNMARIRMATNARRISEAQLRLAVMNTVAQVVKAYWDLVGANESLAVGEQAVANAERLLDIGKKRLDIGTGAALEVLQAKAGVATRQTELITDRSQVANAEDALKQVLNMRENDVFSAVRIVPTDRPKVTELDIEKLKNIDDQLKESYQLALEKRPEMASSKLEIETAKIDRSRAANDMLPQFDLTGSVFQGKRGLEAENVFEGVISRTDNMYTIGVKGSIPLGNRVARGAFDRADLTAKQAEVRLEGTKQELMLRVRLALRAVNTSQILIESNRQLSQMQETNVAAEEKRLRLGVSTSYRVLQMQTDLLAAQTQEVQARIGFEKALVDLRLAEGTLLEGLGIDFAPPEAKPPVSFLRSIHSPEP
jgi:outer membrane protein TolC